MRKVRECEANRKAVMEERRICKLVSPDVHKK
jgi:hypothetical protein